MSITKRGAKLYNGSTQKMTSIIISQKKISQLKDGKECTPYYVTIRFYGFIGHKKGFKNKFFVKTWTADSTGVMHFFGFRFVKFVSMGI